VNPGSRASPARHVRNAASGRNSSNARRVTSIRVQTVRTMPAAVTENGAAAAVDEIAVNAVNAPNATRTRGHRDRHPHPLTWVCRLPQQLPLKAMPTSNL
jgi:hypothetical protein